MWNQLKTVLFLGSLTALAVAAASAFAPSWAFTIAAGAVLFNAAMYFWSDRLVLRLHHARELARDEAPALHAMNDRLAAAAGIPVPRLYLVAAGHANAFATGRGPGHAAIAVTSGLLERLTTRELQGVMAHEMAHVANRDVLIASVAAGLAAIVNAVANAVQFSALFGPRRPVATMNRAHRSVRWRSPWSHRSPSRSCSWRSPARASTSPTRPPRA